MTACPTARAIATGAVVFAACFLLGGAIGTATVHLILRRSR